MKLRALAGSHAALFVCAKLEDELKGLAPSDALELLESYDVHEPGLTQLIHAAYDTLGLQSYLTAGQKEVRAWTILKAGPRLKPPASSIQILNADLSPPKSLTTTISSRLDLRLPLALRARSPLSAVTMSCSQTTSSNSDLV